METKSASMKWKGTQAMNTNENWFESPTQNLLPDLIYRGG
jgi:hypothetical protein